MTLILIQNRAFSLYVAQIKQEEYATVECFNKCYCGTFETVKDFQDALFDSVMDEVMEALTFTSSAKKAGYQLDFSQISPAGNYLIIADQTYPLVHVFNQDILQQKSCEFTTVNNPTVMSSPCSNCRDLEASNHEQN